MKLDSLGGAQIVTASDSPMLRKERGAFFTPPRMSRFVTNWAIRNPNDRVLEPSCGEAAFLVEAIERFHAMSHQVSPNQIHGVELHAASADTARQLVAESGGTATITAADFFDVEPTPTFDAVVGNPPYIRYQQFTGAARAKSIEAALAHGVRLNGLSSSWAAFTVHASQFLTANGRLGLVLPAELLAVSYAASVRRFLLKRFHRVRLIVFEELVFPGVLAEVVLLLAEGQGPTNKIEIVQLRTLDELTNLDLDTISSSEIPISDEKWTRALVSQDGEAAYRELASSTHFEQLVDWGTPYLGAVTGANKFFALTATEAKTLKIPDHELLRISPPGSRHLRGLTFSNETWKEQIAEGARGLLFYPSDEPSSAASQLIAEGERAGVANGFKCRNRRPWFRVPLVKKPDLLMTYMDQERPRIVTNEAGVHVLNSLYGISLSHGRKELGREYLPLACLNSVSLLGAELIGRSYGGGVLKIEPREADRLPIPSLNTVKEIADNLDAIRPQIGLALRRNDLAKAVSLIDRVVLVKHLKISEPLINKIRQARAALFSRRTARGKGPALGDNH